MNQVHGLHKTTNGGSNRTPEPEVVNLKAAPFCEIESVPGHNEIKEPLAKKILKDVNAESAVSG